MFFSSDCFSVLLGVCVCVCVCVCVRVRESVYVSVCVCLSVYVSVKDCVSAYQCKRVALCSWWFAIFLSTLSEPRQADIRKECLKTWGVSTPAYVSFCALSLMTPRGR